ncbi:rhamnogalacturonan lyase family protein [Bacillus sp. FSL K6-3431]|uniref:rhamnogalacturonan lyase family protein n=1 Tax=Bacillus sp. FSL K6-3431 TaxID=2921500 RepID=UPI0030F638C4
MTIHSPNEPLLLGEIDISAAGARSKMLVGDLNQDGQMEIVMVQADGGIDDRYVPHQVICLTAYNLQGDLLWQVGMPDENAGGPGSDYPAQIYDIDGDGFNEILCVMDKKFLILNGQTGEVKQSFDLPDQEAHDCIIIANLTGNPFPQDIILKNRYHQMWALDKDFNVLWEHKGNIGHFPWVYDFDQDGHDEVMAGYDYLDHNGSTLWSCRNLDDHADCIWVGHVDPNLTANDPVNIVVGGSVTVMYDTVGNELWRYEGSIESQHIALGKFRSDLPGLQIAGLDRIIRGDENGKDGLFLLDCNGGEITKEDRNTKGWLTIIETIRHWDDKPLDYVLAYRRGGGINPTLYDGYLNPVVTFPVDGYVIHADLFGEGKEQVIIYNNQRASIFSNEARDLHSKGKVKPQPKHLYSSTLYPGGQY